jgi:L,D-transpeptidase catalytic domain
VGIPAAHRRKRHDDARHRPTRHALRPAYRAGIVGTLIATLLLPAAALAQVPPAEAPEPVQGTMKLTTQKVMRDAERRIALTRTAWRVRGELRPFVPGQTVVVRLFRGGKQIHQQTERLKPIKGRGEFKTPWRALRDGWISVRAVHFKTPEMATVRSNKLRVLVVRPNVGSSGTVVRLLQRGLAKLHYVTSRSGVYDDATARAVMAYRKVRGMARTFSASQAVVRGVLAGRGTFRARYPKHGHHVEADLSRQVLALIGRGGKVERIYHISSGKPSTPTVLGSFRVYRKSPGTNSHGMVHSSYFIGGYAIHGYASVPTYPASHGCLRVPIPSAWSIYTWVRMGDIVDVYP